MEPPKELLYYYYTPEKFESQNNDNYFEKLLDSFENIDSISNKEKNNEVEIYQRKSIEEKIINQSDINAILKVNKNQNNFEKPQIFINKNTNETLDTTKKNGNVSKKGRKNKESIEKRRHNDESLDNLRDKSCTSFMRNILSVLKDLCRKYSLSLKKVNFKKQFGSNCDLNAKFIQTKLYKIFSFNCSHNKMVILKMKEKNDIIFNFLMRSTFEFMYLKYINDEDKICVDEVEYPLPSFITLSEEIIKRKEALKSKVKELSQIEVEKRKLQSFEKQSKNLIKDLKSEGYLKKRKVNHPNSILCNYMTIQEYD